MKFFIAILTLVTSLSVFSAQECPNIDGAFYDKDNGAMWALDQKDNLLWSTTLDSLHTPVILDGKKHKFSEGSHYQVICGQDSLMMIVKGSTPETLKDRYVLKVKVISSRKLIVTEEFSIDGQKAFWKYPIVKF